MRRITKIVFPLIVVAFSFVYIKPATSDEKTVKQKRFNSLGKLCFVSDNDLIVAVCGSDPNGSVRFWSTNEGTLKEVWDLGRHQWGGPIAVSNNGNLVVIEIFPKNETACYSLREKKWLWRVNWVERGVVGNDMRFTPDDRKLVVVGFKEIVTYDAKTGAILQRQQDSKGFCAGFSRFNTRSSAISQSARYAAFWQGRKEAHEKWSASMNIWAVVRDIEAEKVIAKQEKMKQKYKNCSGTFTPDEKDLVLGSLGGHLRVWSITEQKVIREWIAYGSGESDPFQKTPSFDAVGSMTFSRKGEYLATMGFLKGSGFAIRIWDYSSSKLIHEFVRVSSSGHSMGDQYPMAFSPDGRYFAFEQQGQVCLYDTQNWQEKWCVLSWPEGNRVMK
jgi:WD40 repeat protein